MSMQLQESRRFSLNGKKDEMNDWPTTPAFSIPEIYLAGQRLRGRLQNHVIGQPYMVTAVIAALLANIKLALVGKSGVGKTYTGETLAKILDISAQTLPLNPDMTCADITGMMILNPETHKMEYYPSPFLNGTQIIVIDELNRSSDKVQTALLDILNGNRVIVDKQVYPLSEAFTTIMTMNPPEDPGTREIINALADRIDYTLPVGTPAPLAMTEILKYGVSPRQLSPIQMTELDKDTDHLDAGAAKIAFIWKMRLSFANCLKDVDLKVLEAASHIVLNFQDEKVWETPATVRTGNSIVEMATIVAILENKCLPTTKHVWDVAPGCLSMLKPVDWMTTKERISLVKSKVSQLKQQYPDWYRSR